MEPIGVGRRLGPYELIAEIGRGGMAVVYRARQSSLDRFVALKLLAPDLARNPASVARFLREARIAAQLDHPHIVPIYDVGESDGLYYLAMRFVPGTSLAGLIAAAGPLPLDRALRLLAPVADALDYAHAQGIVHRDLKPGNILVEPGDQASLADFGIARAQDGVRLTRLGTIVGTPEYMAPEQALGQEADERSDLYALGVIAYELLAGTAPFRADSAATVLHQHAYAPPPSLDQRRPDLPRPAVAAVHRMLAKDPAARFPSGAALVDALAASAEPSRARPSSPATAATLVAGSRPPAGRGPGGRVPVAAIPIVAVLVGALVWAGTSLARPSALATPVPTLAIPVAAASVPTAPVPTEPAQPTALIPTDTPASPPSPTVAPPLPSPTDVASPTAAASPTPSVDRALEDAVAADLQRLPSPASAVFVNLKGPERVELDPTAEVPAASTIKLAILFEAFRQADAGQLSLAQQLTVTPKVVVGGTGVLQNQVGRTLSVQELLETMVTYSDNTAGNMLIDLLGMDNVNATLRAQGFAHTRLGRHFMDTAAQQRGLDNVASAGDAAELLRRMAQGQLVSPAASAEMIRILRLRGQQTDPTLDFLGRRLDLQPPLAHVNGILPGIRNDAGIVESGDHAYVLAIYLRGQHDEAAAETAIADASKAIFDAVASG